MSFDELSQSGVSPIGNFPLVATPDAIKALATRLEGLFQSMRDELVSSLCLILGNRDDAMDVAQEAFLRCWKNRDKLHEVGNHKAWIFRVGINAAKDLRRSAWRRKSRPMLADEAMPPTKTEGIPEAIEAGEDRARLRIAVKQLKPLEREVFLMRQNGDLTLEEIAHELGRPVGTVKTQLRSALRKLRIALGEPDRSEPDRKTKGGNEES